MDGLDAYLYLRHERARLDAEAATKPRGKNLTIEATDGARLAATLWEPPAGPRAEGLARTVVVASATGVRRAYYGRFAAWLAARGAAVLTFDYRGIGGSRRAAERANMRMHDWGERDLAGVVRWASERDRTRRVALVGHSVGGQLLGLLPEPSLVSAAVTVASQSGDYRLWPLPSRLAMAALWYGVVPSVTRAVGYLPSRAFGAGEDLPPGVALEWAAWCRTPGYLAASRGGSFERLRAPVLAFGFDDDPYAPAAAIDALHALYVNARVTRRRLARSDGRFGHFGFFRERSRALWREAALFLERADA